RDRSTRPPSAGGPRATPGGEGDRSGSKKPPSAQEVQGAPAALPKADHLSELPTDEKARRFQLSSPASTDLRQEIFQLMVQKGWILLELRRDAQSLEDVFKTLTKGDELKDRGRRFVEEEEEEDEEDASSETGAGAG